MRGDLRRRIARLEDTLPALKCICPRVNGRRTFVSRDAAADRLRIELCGSRHPSSDRVAVIQMLPGDEYL